MIAEKCEAVFGRPIMLQINGIDHVYDLDHKRGRERRAYSMGPPVRSKKSRHHPPSAYWLRLDMASGKWSASSMTDQIFPLTRREFVAGLGSAILGPVTSSIALAGGRPPLMLQAKADV